MVIADLDVIQLDFRGKLLLKNIYIYIIIYQFNVQGWVAEYPPFFAVVGSGFVMTNKFLKIKPAVANNNNF